MKIKFKKQQYKQIITLQNKIIFTQKYHRLTKKEKNSKKILLIRNN